MSTNKEQSFPKRDNNAILEAVSERYFRDCLPPSWLCEKPANDFGIDLIVTPVIDNMVIGINFSVQLKAKQDAGGKPELRVKKTSLHYWFTRLEPLMLVLFDQKTNTAWWKWLRPEDFDLTREIQTYPVVFDLENKLSGIDWKLIADAVQKLFKIKNTLGAFPEYDIFHSATEFERKAWSQYLTKNLPDAAINFKKLIQQQGQKFIWLLCLAQCQYQLHDYQQGIITINKAIEIETTDNALLTKGCILAEDGIKTRNNFKLVEAEKIFEALYLKKPDGINAFNLANTLSKHKKHERALELYKAAIKTNKNWAEAWKNLGQVYNDLHKHETALKYYGIALAINPALKEAIVSKAITEGQFYHKYDQAIKTILDVIRNEDSVFFEFPQVFFWLGEFYFKTNHPDEALNWINKGLDNSPGDAYLINLKSKVLFAFNNQTQILRQAIPFFHEHHRANSDNNHYLYFLCCCLEKDNQTEEAFTLIKAWLNKNTFTFNVDELPDGIIVFHEALLLIRDIDIIASYLDKYPIEKIKNTTADERVRDSDELFHIIDVKRMIYIVRLVDYFHTGGKLKNLSKELPLIFQSTILAIDKQTAGDLITVEKTETNEFAEQLTHVGMALKDICMIECARCTGFVIGNIPLTTAESKIPLENIIPKSMDLDTFLHFLKLFYEYFGLPLE